YKKKTQAMIDQWDGLKADGGKVDGKLTLAENIADNGGVMASLEALKTEKIQTIKNFLNHGQVFGVKKQPKNKVSPQFSQMFMHHMN
ncbi:TPA: M13-type metalloendopeptidase, partial [Streptococcus agalactiae]